MMAGASDEYVVAAGQSTGNAVGTAALRPGSNMREAKRSLRPSSVADPFGERPAGLDRRRMHLLGASFEFESGSPALLRLVDAAYGGLPRHRLPRVTPRFRIRLQLTGERRGVATTEPPAPHYHGGAGLLTAVMDADNCAVLCPGQRSGLVAISRRVLRHAPRLARYELLEFAVYALAHRGLGLVSLHAACVGHDGRGLLLVGESGAGKSVVSLHGALRGLDFLTEDSTFVDARTMQATGIASFLHLRPDALRWLDDDAVGRRIRRSPSIRRRSGVEKLEVDMRRVRAPARGPVTLAGIVLMSGKPAGRRGLIRRVEPRSMLDRLESSQAYASQQPGWPAFLKRAAGLPAFELRRAAHPADSADALRDVLDR